MPTIYSTKLSSQWKSITVNGLLFGFSFVSFLAFSVNSRLNSWERDSLLLCPPGITYRGYKLSLHVIKSYPHFYCLARYFYWEFLKKFFLNENLPRVWKAFVARKCLFALAKSYMNKKWEKANGFIQKPCDIG